MSLKHSQNKGAPHFPHDYPDCPAGARFQEEQETELLDKFKRSAGERAGKEPTTETLFVMIIIIRNMARTCFKWRHLVLPKLLCIL